MYSNIIDELGLNDNLKILSWFTISTKSKKLLHEPSTAKKIGEFARNIIGLGSERMRDITALNLKINLITEIKYLNGIQSFTIVLNGQKDNVWKDAAMNHKY